MLGLNKGNWGKKSLHSEQSAKEDTQAFSLEIYGIDNTKAPQPGDEIYFFRRP